MDTVAAGVSGAIYVCVCASEIEEGSCLSWSHFASTIGTTRDPKFDHI